MENTDVVTLVKEFGLPLGMSVSWVWILWKTIVKKDERIKELSDSILDVVRKNTEVQAELKASIKENTQASQTLTSRVREVLNSHRGKE